MRMKLYTLIGAVALSAIAFGQTRQLDSGQTAVTLSPSFLMGASGMGVGVTPVLPSQLISGVVSFPVTAGTLDLTNARGEVSHSGGLELVSGSTKVQLLNFVIDTTASEGPKLTGIVVANGSVVGRGHLFDLEIPSMSLPLQPQNDVLVTVSDVKVKLSAAAAEGLNALFNVQTFTPGLEIGNARLSLFLGRRAFTANDSVVEPTPEPAPEQ